LLCDV